MHKLLNKLGIYLFTIAIFNVLESKSLYKKSVLMTLNFAF